jgi:hypothetical protein
MTRRRFRNLVILAAMAGVAYWIYKDRPTPSGIIDAITNPLLGSKAAVETSERNRVVGDANNAVTEQADVQIAALKEGMTAQEVRDLLGDPEKVETEKKDGVTEIHWTYGRVHRLLTLREQRVSSISILP